MTEQYFKHPILNEKFKKKKDSAQILSSIYDGVSGKTRVWITIKKGKLLEKEKKSLDSETHQTVK